MGSDAKLLIRQFLVRVNKSRLDERRLVLRHAMTVNDIANL